MSTPEKVTEAVTDAVLDRLEVAVDSVVWDIREALRDAVSKPVGRSGTRIIRSKPGEPPRRETGKYQGSITHYTRRQGNAIRGAAGTPMQRGVWLNHGTSRMAARPHFDRVYQEARDTAAQRIKDKL